MSLAGKDGRDSRYEKPKEEWKVQKRMEAGGRLRDRRTRELPTIMPVLVEGIPDDVGHESDKTRCLKSTKESTWLVWV